MTVSGSVVVINLKLYDHSLVYICTVIGGSSAVVGWVMVGSRKNNNNRLQDFSRAIFFTSYMCIIMWLFSCISTITGLGLSLYKKSQLNQL